jgi:hypothetical protein
LPYGTLTPNADGAKSRLAEGFTFLGIGSDIAHLLGAINNQYQQLRAVLPE